MKSTHKILLLLLILNFLRGILYSTTVPLWQMPDEHWHFEYIKLLEKGIGSNIASNETYRREIQFQISQSMVKHEFVKFRNINPQKPLLETYAFSRDQLRQPRLYYLTCAILLKILPFNNIEIEAYTLRWVSGILGTCVVYLGYVITKAIFPKEPFLFLGVPTFIVFLPQYTFMSSGINNDKLAEVLFSLLLLLFVMGFRYRLSCSGFGYTIILIVLGMLTKRTFFLAIPLYYIFFVIYFGQRKNVYRTLLNLLLAYIAITVIFLFENFESYIEISFSQILSNIMTTIQSFPVNFTRYIYYTKLMLSSFWASFGWLDIYLDNSWYMILLIVDLLAVIGAFRFGVKLFKGKTILELWQKKSLAILVFSTLIVFAQTFIRDTILFSAYPHSRLLFVTIIPICIFFMIGIKEWLERISWHIALIIIFFLLASFDAMCLYHYIIPFYYGVFN